MRISDWSSDVCSADRLFRHLEIQDEQGLLGFGLPIYQHPMESNLTLAAQMLRDAYQGPPIAPMRRFLDPLDVRSEEHTSELQSLMRISYAVFCLKQNNNRRTYLKYRK